MKEEGGELYMSKIININQGLCKRNGKEKSARLSKIRFILVTICIIVAIFMIIYTCCNMAKEYKNYRIVKVVDVTTRQSAEYTLLVEEEGGDLSILSLTDATTVNTLADKRGYYLVIADYYMINKAKGTESFLYKKVYDEPIILTETKEEAENRLNQVI